MFELRGSTRRPHIGDLAIKLFFLLWGPPFMTCECPKLVHFGPKMAEHGGLVNVPKGPKKVKLTVFDWLGPFWAHLDPFGPIWTHLS